MTPRYAEALAVPVVALLCLAGVRAWARHTLAASKFNAKAVAGLFAFLACDLALWLLAWARGLPFEHAYFFARLLWGSLAAMFADPGVCRAGLHALEAQSPEV